MRSGLSAEWHEDVMRYQGSEALNMNYAGNFVPEERSQETPFEVLPGGGLDARARRGVSPEFVANVRNVLVVAAVLILLGLVRVVLSSAAVAALNTNETLSDQVTDAKNLNDDLKIERAVLSSNSRISRIATQNYGMVLSNDAMDIKVGDAAAQEQAAQEQAAAVAAAQAKAAEESAAAVSAAQASTSGKGLVADAADPYAFAASVVEADGDAAQTVSAGGAYADVA